MKLHFTQSLSVKFEQDYLSYLPYLMVVISFAILLMATYSKMNKHPDEYVHYNAVEYYKSRIIPPKACSVESLDSYSVYGFSRLDKFELAYLVNGKFFAMIDILPLFDYVKARLFNVFLFLTLTLLSIKLISFRLFTLPLIISPQIWYMFSYVNSEAYCIFISIIACYLLFYDNSIFYQLFRRRLRLSLFKKMAYLSFCSLIFFLLVFVKETFYFLFVFIFCAFIIKHYKLLFNKTWLKTFYKARKYSMLIILAMVTIPSSLWIYSHEKVNDFNRQANMEQCRLQVARAEYSPESPLEQTLQTLYLKEKGYPISFLLEKGWHQQLFFTSFGYFGYKQIPASQDYYHFMAASFMGFISVILLLCLQQALQRRLFPLILFVGTFLSFVLIDVTALIKSWNGDFQPQGRYFFSLINMLGIILLYNLNQLQKSYYLNILLHTISIVMFSLSLYFFIYVGFTEIEKII